MLIYTGTNTIFKHEYTKEIQNLIEKDEEENKSSEFHSKFSYILDKKLNSSGVGDIFEIINCSITFIIILFYIISTYTYPPTSTINKKINSTIEEIELYLLSSIILHFILKFYVSQQRLLFLLELTTLVDISSIIMIVLSKTNVISYNAKYFFRLFRMVRIIYLFKIEYLLQKKSNETVRHLFKLSIVFISLVFLSASSILEIENYYFRLEYGDYTIDSSEVELNGKGTTTLMRFHDVVYFELVTLTTIGYGDITPKHWISRYIIIITVIALLVIVLPLYSKLKVIFTLTTKYSRMTYQKSSKKVNHVLVLGECGIESYEAFLEELYHADHGQTNYDTIIMQSNQNKGIMKLIKSLSYGQKIFYLVGNSLIQKDLERCKADTSICAVILANRLAKNPRLEDFSNIMKAFSIRKFKHIFSKEKNSRICIQLLRPETKEIYYSSLISDNEIHYANTQIICVEEIKLQLLGKSCLCPGITTIISSLITSKKPSVDQNIQLSKEYDWLKEYLYGIQQEIYFVSLKAELMHNLKFIDIVRLVYKVSGLVVIGIDVIIDNLKPFVCLNPSNYLISPFDTLVYILADSQPDSEELNNLIRNYLENNSKGIVEKNREMVKLLRLKSFYWNKMANIPDYFHNPEMQASLGIKFSNDNYMNNDNNKNVSDNNNHINELKKERNNSKPFKKNSIKSEQLNNNANNNDMNNYKLKLEQYGANRKNFFHTLLPRTQHKAESFSPDILDNHIIVCGIGLNLKNLLMPLRASSMKNQQYPIVIIDKAEHIPSEIWKEIQYYPDIYYMQGNPVKSKDLHKAGIKKAKAVIILSKSTSDLEQSDMVDADTIFIYKAIKNETKSTMIIAELVSVSALSFLNSNSDENLIKKQGYWLSPSFAVGEIFIGSMLDTLICQAFYNPFITDILKQLIMGSAGSNFSTNLQLKLMEKKITQSTLYLLSINEELTRLGYREMKKSMKYKEIFDFFVKNKMVPIGLHRNNKKLLLNNNSKNKAYVYLCPKREDIVEVERDKIYVLANENHFSRQKIQESNQKMNTYFKITKTSKLIDKSNELILNLTLGLKKVVENGSQKMRQNFSIKKVINEVRDSMRNELSNIYDDLIAEEDDNANENNDEDSKGIKEEENERSKSNSGYRSHGSRSSEGINSSPSKSYMEALKRTQNYMKTHRQKKSGDNKKSSQDEKSD